MINRDQLMEFVRSEDTDATFGTLSTDDLHEIMLACCMFNDDLEQAVEQTIKGMVKS